MAINHSFVSAKSDGTDATQIQPSNWNAAHLINSPTGLLGGTGVLLGIDVAGLMSFDGIKSSAALQYLRRNATNLAYEFAAGANYYSPDYNFTQQAPAESLSPSLRTFTLTTVPLGVNGTDTNHYLGIYNNAGVFQEAILISGGSAVSGAATGTITASAIVGTYAAGAYKIGSTTVGIQEAIQVAGLVNGRVNIPGGSYNIYSLINIPYTMSLRGSGIQNTRLTLPTGYVTRAMQCITPSGNHGLDLGDFTISYTTSGTSLEGLYLQEISDGFISNLAIIHSYSGITAQGLARVLVQGVNLFPMLNGYNISSSSGSSIVNVSVPTFLGGFVTMNSSAAGTVFSLGPTIAGINIIGVNSVLGSNAISAVASSGAINEINVIGCIFDSLGSYVINLALTGTATASRWGIYNTKIANATGGAGGILASTSTTGNITDFEVCDCPILLDSATATGLNLQGIVGGKLIGLIVNNNQAGGTACLLDGTACKNVDIKTNNFGSSSLYLRTGNIMAYGIFVNNQAHADISITGNTLIGSTAALVNNSTTANGVKWFNNIGVDDVIAAVVAAGTVAFPVNLLFMLSGATGVTAVSGLFTGMRGSFVATNATPGVWTAGATIGATFTPTQNKVVNYFFDGTKIWLS